MRDHNLEITTESKSGLSRQGVERQAEDVQTQSTLSPRRDPLSQVISGTGSVLSASAHASMLNRAMTGGSRAEQSLLQLQRQYGNRYVQRVLALARKGSGKVGAAPELEQSIQQARGSGQALEKSVQGRMELAFGADFDGVRVHTDTKAEDFSRELNACAFTTGQDIFFRNGAYNSGSSSGRELLAHELTHVGQQTGMRHKMTLWQSGDKYEREADEKADTVVNQEQYTETSEFAGKCMRRQAEEDTEKKLETKREGDTLRRREGDKEEEVQPKPGTGLLQRQPEQEEEVEELTFTEKMAEEKVLTVEEEMEYYVDALVNFFQNTAINYNTACGCFRSTMFEKKAGASPDLVGTVLSEGIQIVINKLVECAGKRMPGLGDAVITVSTAVSKEIEAAREAAKANKLVDFINNAAKKVMSYLTRYSQKISSRKDDYLKILRKEAGSPSDTVRYVLFGLELNKIRRSLLDKLATSDEIERSLYEGWMRHSERGRAGGLFGATEMKQGILLLHYQIDEKEELAELDRMVLVGPYAEQVKMGLKGTIGERIDTKTLDFTRLVQVEKDRQHRWPIIVAPGKIPRDDPMHYFSKLIKELPTIDLGKVTTEEEIPVWP